MVDLEIPGLGHADFIGRGGFGTVYRSREEALNRVVAVKVIRAAEASDTELRLFERECAAAGSLAWCPDIVSVHSTGTTPQGDPYLVMEFAPGGSLRDRAMTSGTMGEEEARQVAHSMARALAAAHGAGLLHRDVKPANILISQTGSYLLADFGIAKALAGSGHTSTMAMAGTIAYMAPELLHDRPATAASDIFSLGATLLQLLTGGTPFSVEGDDSAASMMRRALQTREVDLSGVPVSASFRGILAGCLAIDPASRFASGVELLAALDAIEDSAWGSGVPTAIRPVQAPPVTPVSDSTVLKPGRAGSTPPISLPPPMPNTVEMPTPTPQRRARRTGPVVVVGLIAGGLIAAAMTTAVIVLATQRDTGEPARGSRATDPVAATSFEGHWEGTAVQRDDKGTTDLLMELRLVEGGVGDVVGRTTYFLDDGSCQGTLTLNEMSVEKLSLTEDIVTGSCVGTGGVTVTPVGDDGLDFSYTTTKHSGAVQRVDATLRRAD